MLIKISICDWECSQQVEKSCILATQILFRPDEKLWSPYSFYFYSYTALLYNTFPCLGKSIPTTATETYLVILAILIDFLSFVSDKRLFLTNVNDDLNSPVSWFATISISFLIPVNENWWRSFSEVRKIFLFPSAS